MVLGERFPVVVEIFDNDCRERRLRDAIGPVLTTCWRFSVVEAIMSRTGKWQTDCNLTCRLAHRFSDLFLVVHVEILEIACPIFAQKAVKYFFPCFPAVAC